MRPIKAAFVLLATSIAGAALARDSEKQPAKGLLPTDALVKQWWQRYLSIPNDVSAGLGESRAACGLAQFGNTWFLSVTTPVGPATRDCTIPRGRKILVPLVTAVCTPFPGETLEQNIQFCREAIDPYD